MDVKWNDDAVSAVVEGSSGYPYFLQGFGKTAWDYAPGPAITPDDAAVGIRAGTESLDHGFFRSRWERVNASERAYMRAMAETMKAPANPARYRPDWARGATAVAPTRATLIHKGLIYAPQHGLVAFTVPGMADFINRQPTV